MTDLRQTPIPRALHRPNLILGGERMPMMVALGASIGLAVSSMNLVALTVGALTGIFSVFSLRKAAKVDPMMFKIFGRQRSYRPYYHPFSRPWREAEKGQRGY